MNIVKATAAYETWMRKRLPVVIAPDLARKHAAMAEAPFPFFRATFYRWASIFPDVCSELARAPHVLAVGDLHLENFGTWRDIEGRLAWGVDDFDEACPLSYTNDLVRLATSAILARHAGRHPLTTGERQTCTTIRDGYLWGLKDGTPFLLEDERPMLTGLRAMALGSARDPAKFWPRLIDLKSVKPPATVRSLLVHALPAASTVEKIVRRVAGIGSLGRQRFAILADCDGGRVVREAKAVLGSACSLIEGKRESTRYREILTQAIRARDPFVTVTPKWIVRRLAPHCSSISLDDFPKKRDESLILAAMGAETANIHRGSSRAIARVRDHLRAAPKNWLYDAASRMADKTRKDWKKWRGHWNG